MNSEQETEAEIIDILKKHKKISISKKHQFTVYHWATVTGICILAIIALIFLYSAPKPFKGVIFDGPYGKIISPVSGTITNTEVSVTAETANIDPGQYIWLAVDKPDIGLCWPKKQKIKPNCSFKMTLHEEGPKEPYTLSLYAVNKTINDQWETWLEPEKHGGLPMPPDKRRLASVVLVLGG